MKTIVISLGGSVLFSDDVDVNYFKKLSVLLNKFVNDHKFFLIIGGGKISRKYIEIGRKLGFNEKILDDIGINITRINAKILLNTIKNSNNIVPKSINKAIKMDYDIVIMGGSKTGHSTDYVGAILSSKTNANKFIIATNVDGVYDKDPNKYKNTKKIDEINILELINKYGTTWKKAGSNVVIDGPSLKIIYKNKIPTYVLNGKKLDELEKAILDKKFNGTIIKN